MSQFTISPGNSLQATAALKEAAKDVAGFPAAGQTASRQYVTTTDNSASITVETTEGDKVTLEYKVSTEKKNYIRVAGTEIPGLEESLASHRENSVTIEGELNEEERADIAAFKEEVSAILDAYFAANSQISGSQLTLDLSKYQALGKYAMALDSVSSTSWATEMVSAVARPSQNNLEAVRQQKVEIAYGNSTNTLASSEDLKITRQDSAPQFDYAVTRIQQQSAQVEGQTSRPQTNNPPDYTELRKATQEVFAQQVYQLRDEWNIQKINALGKDIDWLLGQLAAREEKTAAVQEDQAQFPACQECLEMQGLTRLY